MARKSRTELTIQQRQAVLEEVKPSNDGRVAFLIPNDETGEVQFQKLGKEIAANVNPDRKGKALSERSVGNWRKLPLYLAAIKDELLRPRRDAVGKAAREISEHLDRRAAKRFTDRRLALPLTLSIREIREEFLKAKAESPDGRVRSQDGTPYSDWRKFVIQLCRTGTHVARY